MDTRLVPDVVRIAVLRANALGDLVFALPALEALRGAYPEAEITLLGDGWHQAFLEGRPSPVDRVVPVPAVPGIRDGLGGPATAAEIQAFVARMRAERFDLALQLHGGGRASNPFVRLLGARVTAGLRSPDAAPLDRSLPYVFFQHEVLRYLEVVGLVGAAPVGLEPRLAVTDADRDEAAAVVPDAGPLVVLHPVASDRRRWWPVEEFAAVADALAAEGATVAVIGTAAERRHVAEVVDAMAQPVLDLAGRLTLGGLVGLLDRADLVLGNDSGPLHVASAVGTPSVGIFWATTLGFMAPLFRSRHRPLASLRVHCPVCGQDQTRRLCGHEVSYVAEVQRDEVLAACRDLLGWPPRDPVALARALDWRAPAPGPG